MYVHTLYGKRTHTAHAHTQLIATSLMTEQEGRYL